MNFDNRSASFYGFFSALGAFLMWGLLPVYWKSLQQVPAFEILCHRISWSLAFVVLLLTLQKRWGETFAALKSKKTVALLTCSGCIVGANWFIYIWAVNAGHVVETSLGYYINPLVNALFGFVFFRDRLRSPQILAVVLALLGVANLIVNYGHFPVIALTLALSFACYGLIRKIAAVESIPGLFFETLVLAPFAAVWLVYQGMQGQGAFLHTGMDIDLLLICAGAVTSLPLIGFAFGARRLRLTTLGILQYLAPTCAFLLGVFLYREPFTATHLATFALIWAGIAVYTFDSVRYMRRPV